MLINSKMALLGGLIVYRKTAAIRHDIQMLADF